ncbi:hypothetical protein [Vibrio metschnikovii]|uniref:hypothetical protein n=1 Tax=Vibrio metschnikovii TaxID=28172 RepID=UPI001C30E60B|nr:hypothetical protein [Vibrio metschnikovii]
MKYFLKQMILDPTIAISINLEMFTRLKTSLNTLHAAKAVEETYDLLIQNYLEFEQELLTILARQMIIEEESYDDLYTIIISRLNRRVVNLLTSTKLYYDHIEKHVRICMKDDDEGKIAKKFFSTEYDKHLEYRFMDAMRNYVQHYGLAVHSISLQRNWEESNNHKQLVYKIQMYTWKDELSKDKTFKKKVLLEISDKVDLLKSIRVYISSLSSVHQQVRSQIKDT